MISILVSEENSIDADILLAEVKDVVAKQWDEDVEIRNIYDPDELDTYISERERLQAAIVDVTVDSGVQLAKRLRRRYPEIEILIVSDVDVSPIVYLNPEVRASSLLLKPLEGENLTTTITQFLELLEEEACEQGLEVDVNGKKRRFPYRRIQYFEAKDKKVYMRAKNIEYPLYETIEHLLETLPTEFVRCHRSYIVNIIHIERVRYSENYIVLRGELILPLSRGYKAEIKEVMKAYE